MFKKDAFEKETKLLRLTKLEPRFKLDLECHLPTKSEDKILSDQWERCLQTSDDKKSNKVKYDKDIKNNYGSGHCNPPITENLGDRGEKSTQNIGTRLGGAPAETMKAGLCSAIIGTDAGGTRPLPPPNVFEKILPI